MKRLLLSTLLLLSSPVIAQWRDIKISSTTDVGAIQENFRRASLWSNRKMDKFGNDTIYGQPIFKNGVKFGDGTIQNTAGDVVLAATQTFTGSNSFTATGAGGTTISSATIKQLNGSIKMFGAWIDKTSSYGAQQAANDGFVIAYSHAVTAGTLYCYTDSSNPPTTIRQAISVAGSSYMGNVMCPVRKGDYWKVVIDGGQAIDRVSWLPIGN